MNNKEKPRERQREFLFVFSNGCTSNEPPGWSDESGSEKKKNRLDEERTKLLRRRLISELRDLGC